MIGQRIREARKAKGLSQGQLAQGMVSRSYITALENGRIRPTACFGCVSSVHRVV
ncbi:MAG: helix-turn-helix transcriptional regulator [Selenomonadales bacterium]|nr:helix-turn-helix transcriptional regulator [Selenomonadales bacterium]